ncbi:MAG: hypothetical protein R3C52_15390 [Hyphomonadaceae bacterium]
MRLARIGGLVLALAGAGAALSACETVEGYRQQMATWQGRSGDDLLIAWGPPDAEAMLSDGRTMWAYEKQVVSETGGYYRDEQRSVTRTFTDKDGKQRTEVINETFPVWEPPSTTQSYCKTRFVLSPQRRIEQVSFDGGACVAPERNG